MSATEERHFAAVPRAENANYMVTIAALYGIDSVNQPDPRQDELTALLGQNGYAQLQELRTELRNASRADLNVLMNRKLLEYTRTDDPADAPSSGREMCHRYRLVVKGVVIEEFVRQGETNRNLLVLAEGKLYRSGSLADPRDLVPELVRAEAGDVDMATVNQATALINAIKLAATTVRVSDRD